MSYSLLEHPPYAHLFVALVLGWIVLNARLLFRDREDVRRESSGSRLALGLSSAVGILGAIYAYQVAPRPPSRPPALRSGSPSGSW